MAIHLPYLGRSRDKLGLRWLQNCRDSMVGAVRREALPHTPAVIISTLSAASGIGKGAQLMLADLARRGMHRRAVDVTGWHGLPASETGAANPVAGAELPLLPRVVHLNPPHFGRVLRQLGRAVFAAPVVGYWAWELEAAPAEWLASAQLVDEIWVPAPFVHDAVRKLLEGVQNAPPVRVVPHAVAAGEPFTRDAAARSAARQKLGLPARGFVAGFTYSARAGVQRKNPQGAIAAFRKAFADAGEDVSLLLRCLDADMDRSAWAALQQLAAQDSRIRLLDAAVCRIQDFFSAIDALLSLHRSEGYGLTLAEALRAGIPVIATAWSISDEISSHKLFYPVSSELTFVNDPAGPYRKFQALRWAEPDVDIAAQYLRELRAAHGYHVSNAQA